MRKMHRILIGLACVAVIVVLIAVLGRGVQNFSGKYEGCDLSGGVTGIGREDTYEGYVRACAGTPVGEKAVDVDIASFEGDAEIRDEGGVPVVFTDDGSNVTWKVSLEKAGLYNIRIRYLTYKSRGVDMERELFINGKVPFSGASSLTFTRLWKDGGAIREDNQGNQIRPTQVEHFDWQSVFLKDPMGYVIEPYQFRFEAGENTITLRGVNEPMIIGAITLVPVENRITYRQYADQFAGSHVSENAASTLITVQGEDAALRSTPSLYPRYDRSSPATEPYSVTRTVLNYIGGDAWNHAGEWIEWEFEVPEDGFYHITVKARQSYQRGAISARSIYIDGEIPFEELNVVSFGYGTAWQMVTLSDENKVPYEFYLTKGKHTVRIEATLGQMGPILSEMEESIYRLNQIYRKILVLTGVNPDRFRDYNLPGIYPEVIEAMDLESKRLYKLVDDTVAITGQKNDRVAVAQTLAVQLENFVGFNERITQQFTNFKDNITSLGTAMQNMSETKLDIDAIYISGSKAQLPMPKEGFFARIAHEVRSCVASYTVDYNSLGDKYDDDDESNLIEVWIVTGRDQSTVLKTMVDDSFTPKTGIRVNVKLVVADTLLTAVVAGNGPDVVLSVGSWFPVNYAMRNAVEDIKQFDGWEEVVGQFYPSALASMEYNGGIWALPETQEFSVLFYRKDILEGLGLEPPQTWEDLIALLPTIQGNNMSVGVPYPDIANADMSIFNSLIYQNGGQIYDADAKRTLIDNENGVTAFKLYTSLYNDYGLPTVYDFVSRFRSGEMPIGLANYSTYNTLVVSAPEIRNLWDFTLFPGTVRTNENGETYIDRSVHCSGVCCMMIATDDEKVKQNSWEFMKWWVSAESQVRFGREIESILGSSARYTTANKEALAQLSWSTDQMKILSEQMEWTVGFREIAGGYSTTRHITNAIRKVIISKEEARETLLTYARTINEEIRIKRKEFNLPLD